MNGVKYKGKRFFAPALAAALVAAMAFTFTACSAEDGEEGGNGGGSSSGSGNSGGGGGRCNDIANYKTVTIGSQTWMAENLNCNVAGSKCYSNSESNCDIYGRLYNWSTAMALPSSCNSSACASQVSAKHRGICPQGWHIPSGDDWDALMSFIHEDNGLASFTSGTSSYAGRYLKSASGWYNNGNGTDSYGFAALPGGSGFSDGFFDFAGGTGYRGYWWSASENNAGYAYYRSMIYDDKGAGWYYDQIAIWKINGYAELRSVRCIKD